MFKAWYLPFYKYGIIHGDPHLGNYSADKNFNLNFFEIIFAPVDFPVAAPPSQDIWNFLFQKSY